MPRVGDCVEFQLLRRPRGSITPLPVLRETPDTAAGGSMPLGVVGAACLGSGNASTSSGGGHCAPEPDSASAPPQTNWGGSGGGGSSSGVRRATTTAAAAASCENTSSVSLVTPLAANPYAKYCTLSDPRPLWRAAAQQLGQQLSEVVSAGGTEAQIEAPALFAAADALAQRARRMAEHMVTQLTQRGVPPGAVMPLPPPPQLAAAAAAAPAAPAAAVAEGRPQADSCSSSSSGNNNSSTASACWPLWLQVDGDAAGRGVEQLVRDAFMLAMEGGCSAAAAAARSQATAAALDSQFPSLCRDKVTEAERSSIINMRSSAAGAATPSVAVQVVVPHATKAVVCTEDVGGAETGGGQSTDAERRADVEQQQRSPAAELPFDAAFSEDEDDCQLQQQQQQQDEEERISPSDSRHARAQQAPLPAPPRSTDRSIAAAAAAAEAPRGQPPQPAPMLGGSPTAGASSGLLLGTSPGSSQQQQQLQAGATPEGDYYLYAAADGQWLFLHPINLRVLAAAHGDCTSCPPRVLGRILELEDVTQDETSRCARIGAPTACH